MAGAQQRDGQALAVAPGDRGDATRARRPTSFWSRQTHKDKVALVAFAVQVVITVALLLVNVLSTKLSIATRFALMTGNIVALVATVQFALSRFFDEQDAQFDGLRGQVHDVEGRITQAVEEMESITGLGETYVKIFRQPAESKLQYQTSLELFLRRLSSCIDEKRSGALDAMEYYAALESLAVKIAADKADCESRSAPYTGEIWALSFLTDNEWAETDLREVKWVSTLAEMDQSGIPTRRLWAFDKQTRALLQKDPIEEDGRELVRRLALQCAADKRLPSTTSVALPTETLLDEHVRLFGRGFFAAAFSDGTLKLIRGVSFDDLLTHHSLVGEVDYDEARIRQIRVHWDRYRGFAKPLREFLWEGANKSAQDFMRETWGVDET